MLCLHVCTFACRGACAEAADAAPASALPLANGALACVTLECKYYGADRFATVHECAPQLQTAAACVDGHFRVLASVAVAYNAGCVKFHVSSREAIKKKSDWLLAQCKRFESSACALVAGYGDAVVAPQPPLEAATQPVARFQVDCRIDARRLSMTARVAEHLRSRTKGECECFAAHVCA